MFRYCIVFLALGMSPLIRYLEVWYTTLVLIDQWPPIVKPQLS